MRVVFGLMKAVWAILFCNWEIPFDQR